MAMRHAIVRIERPGEAALQLGSTLARAFETAPDYSFILAHHAHKRRALAWFFGRFSARLCARYGDMLSTADGSAGLMVFHPGRAPSLFGVLAAGVLCFPFRFGLRGTLRAFALGLHMERVRLSLAPEPHLYVLAVGVSPESQGRGQGHDLMTRALEQADARGVPCYLEAFEEHLVQHYQRRGFRLVGQEVLPNGLHLSCLLRAPSATA